MKKKVILLLADIILIPLTLFVFSYIQKIVVSDQSKNFSISYRDSNYFTNLLNSLGVWDERKALIYPNKEKKTIRQIEVVLKDLDSKSLSKVRYLRKDSAESASIDSSGKLTITVYLDPSIKTELASKSVLYAVMEVLYTGLHSNDEQGKNMNEATKIISLFPDSDLPFIVTSQK